MKVLGISGSLRDGSYNTRLLRAAAELLPHRVQPAIAAVAPETPKQCCRTCRKGKACGNGCISQERQCTKEPGCACSASKAG